MVRHVQHQRRKQASKRNQNRRRMNLLPTVSLFVALCPDERRILDSSGGFLLRYFIKVVVKVVAIVLAPASSSCFDFSSPFVFNRLQYSHHDGTEQRVCV